MRQLTKLFHALEKRIKDKTDVKGVYLWNNQPNEQEKENPMKLPAALVEFSDMRYEDLGIGVQKMEGSLSLYIVFASLNYSTTRILDLVQEVSAAVHCFEVPMGGRVSRRRMEQDVNHTNLHVWRIDCVFEMADYDTKRQYTEITADKTTDIGYGDIKGNPIETQFKVGY